MLQIRDSDGKTLPLRLVQLKSAYNRYLRWDVRSYAFIRGAHDTLEGVPACQQTGIELILSRSQK